MIRIYIIWLAALTGSALITSAAPGADDAPSVQVETAPLREQPIRETVTAYGTVTTSDESMADISFPQSGQVASLQVRAGQKFRRDDPLVTITLDPATLQGYQTAVTTLAFAQRELTRMQNLFAQHLATNTQVAAAQKAVTDATVALETERSLGNDQRSKTATAPFNGYVAKIMISPGDRLQANTAIMTLARTDQDLHVAIGLKPEDAVRIKPGMTVQLTPVLSARSQPGGGTVGQIGGSINSNTRLIDSWIDVTQPTTLVTGESVMAVIILAEHNGWVVPRNAVLHDTKGSYIFQVANGRAKRIEVTTGVETDTLTEVSGSFDPSLKIIFLGNYELSDGMAVRELSSKTTP